MANGNKTTGVKTVAFGEIMLKLQPEGFKRFTQADRLEMSFGGGEANVAVSLACLGQHAVFLTKLPQNAIGDACLNKLRGLVVDVSHTVRGKGRMGIYFAEKGASQRASKVIYDRQNSSVNTLDISEINTAEVFKNAAFFHYTGITAALSDTALNTLLLLIKAAKAANVKVSCDLNYRKNLWSRERAKEVMTKLVSLTDILISNEEDCKDVFGIEADGTDIDGGKINPAGYKNLAARVLKMFPNIQSIAFTLRESISASINGWSAIYVQNNGGLPPGRTAKQTARESCTAYFAPRYNINIVDRVGGGDSFAAGLLYALGNGKDAQYAVEFAAAASCLKHTVEGDFNLVTLPEIEALAKGNASGRVQR